MSKNPHIGSTFSDFLKEEGIYEDVTAHAVKRVLAWQIQHEMKRQGITKVEMAKRMKTSRAQLDRLLDPDNGKVIRFSGPRPPWDGSCMWNSHEDFGGNFAGRRQRGETKRRDY